MPSSLARASQRVYWLWRAGKSGRHWDTTRGLVVTVRDDPTFRLGRALADQRAVADQATALGVFLGGCAMWRFSPLHEPEPLTGIVISVGGLVLGSC